MTEAHVTNTAHLRKMTERIASLEGQMLAVVQVLNATDKRVAALETELTGSKRILAEIKEMLAARNGRDPQ